jgi:hypothetical protein
MKKTIIVAVFTSILAAAVLFAPDQSSSGVHAMVQKDRTIEGTWLTLVTPVNCETGAPVGPAFRGILSFNTGGTMSGTSTVAASVFGVWARSGGWENYTFAFTNFRYNSSGVLVGSQVVRQSITLAESGDAFVSRGTVGILDADGNQIGTGCANSTGTRFE